MSATRRKVVPSLLLGLAAVRAVLPVDLVQQLTATLLSHCLINPIVLIELRLAQFDQHTFWTKRRCCDFVLDLSDLRSLCFSELLQFVSSTSQRAKKLKKQDRR